MIKNEQAKLDAFMKVRDQAAANDSGQGDQSSLPDELRGLNWGGLLLNFVWGLAMKIPLTWLHLIPIVGWVMPLVMWTRGNEWAWKHRRWESVDQFKKVQEKWMIAGVIFTVISIILSIALVSWVESLMMTMIGSVY